VFNLPGNRVRVIAPDVGGAFGSKGCLYPDEMVACALSIMLGRPIKWVSDRLEDLVGTYQAFDEHVEAHLALDGEGRILGVRADAIGDVGAYSIYPWTAAMEPVQVISFLPGPYRMPTYRARTRAVATPKTPMGAYRGVGRPMAAFVMERLIDLGARELGIDPLEMRRRNLVQPSEFPYKTGSGIVWDRAGFTESLEAAVKHIGYDALRADQEKAREEGRMVGIGLACYAELTGIGSRIAVAPGAPINTGIESASIRIDATGSVAASFGIASHGQGLETTLAQVVAEELGCRIEDVEVLHGDSTLVAHGTGTYASRSTILAGGAATLAARALRQNVLHVAAQLMEVAEKDLDLVDGRVFVPGTDKELPLREVARSFYQDMGRLPKEVREEYELEATRSFDPYFGTTAAATHIAVVEVDPVTWGVTVLRYVVAEDCGRIINPLIVDGQVHGGVAQGVGVALLEEVVHDADGQILSASLVDYLLPTAVEIPAMDVLHVESENPDNLTGFRGMGEGGTIGAPAAIANAVADALASLGVDVTTLPLTPERIFRLVEAAKAAGRTT
jgi:carbon-monoxide dehydrogenase large subunit